MMDEQNILVEQRSKQWFEIRKGKITSSEIHKIMGVKDTLTDTAKTYLLEKASEYFDGFSEPATGVALEWGTELEPIAIQVYEEKTGVSVQKASFIPMGEHYGGSPDGLVPPEGIIEVKCPYKSYNHFKHSTIKTPELFKKVAPNYYYQCMSNMICAKAKWCDFISFDPRVKDFYQMYIYRLEFDEKEAESIQSRLEIAIKYMDELKANIESSFS